MGVPRTFRATVDRIEGDVAVLLPVAAPGAPALRAIHIDVALLPDAREGVTLVLSVQTDERATAALAGDVRHLVKDLKKDDDGGDFGL